MPKTSLAERANDHQLVSQEEKGDVRLDGIMGLLSLAHFLRQEQLNIAHHTAGEDFYLYADTNPSFALFLIQNCQFRGNARAGRAWIKASEFSSDENIAFMLGRYEKLKDDLRKS